MHTFSEQFTRRLKFGPILRVPINTLGLAGVVLLLATGATTLVVNSYESASADEFETFHPYLKDETDNKGFRGTRVSYGPWLNTGPAWSLRFLWMDAYSNMWYPQYEWDYVGWQRTLLCGYIAQMDPANIHITEQTTPRYDRHNYYDYMDQYGLCQADAFVFTMTTDYETLLLVPGDTAHVEVIIPFNSLDAYQFGSGQATTLP